MEARDRIIKAIIIDHWRENGGRVPAFGRITGYVLVLVAGYAGFDFGLPFSVTGDRTVSVSRSSRTPIAGSASSVGFWSRRLLISVTGNRFGFGPSSNFMSEPDLPKRNMGAVESQAAIRWNDPRRP